ncbi:MAG: PAS domain S-box protein, partial [Anaerolineaceae bacterium]
MKWYKSRTVYLFSLIGILGGAAFLVIGTWLEFNRQRLPSTLWSFWYLHRTEPMIFILDLAPLVMGIMAGLIGLQRNLSAAISQGEKEWEVIFDSFSNLIFVTDTKNIILRCNHTVVDRLNTKLSDVIGKPLSEVLGDGYLELQKTGTTEFTWLQRLYEVFIHSVQVEGAEPQNLVILQDITERKQAESALYVERNLLRQLIDNIPDRVYVKDTEGRKTLSNKADMQASGAKTMEEVIGKTDFDIYPAELAGKYWADDKFILDIQSPVVNREELRLDEYGNSVWMMTTKVPIKDSQENITGFIGIGRDITRQKMSEMELKRQKQFYETLISNSPVAIVVLDNDEKISSCNPAFESLFGYESRKIIGVSLDTLTEETIGFTFAPRLNALGRLGDANPAVELLLTDDSARARVLAAQIEGLNAQRRLLTSQVYEAAEGQLKANPDLLAEPAILLSHPNWPGGVVGIVANKLVERYHKPALLFTESDDGILRGSARSIEGLHI